MRSAEVHVPIDRTAGACPSASSGGDGRLRDLKTQFVNALLVILTVAAVCCAVINFRQQSLYHLPDDGVTWVDRAGSDGQNRVIALHVSPGSPGDNAGIRAGDSLLEAAGIRIGKTTDVPQALQSVGVWTKAQYMVERGGVTIDAPVILGERVLDRSQYYQYVVGLAYLLIGLFVYCAPCRGAPVGALLHSVPGFVRPVLLPLHWEAERIRPGDLLGQRCGRRPGADDLSCISAWYFRSARSG